MAINEDEIALDYFAGSGTTAHAIINLNREDEGQRKYILVEMGQYFDTVTKPRVQKVIYSTDWKDGKPISRQGSSHIMKYFRMESYEDTLNNLRLARTEQQSGLLALNDDFSEEYMLHYWLDVESREHLLSTDIFSNPFDYRLNLTENNESVPTKVDMIETFNYLIGLQVRHTERIQGFHVVKGTTLKGHKTLIIWRNIEAQSNEALNDFFQKMGYNARDSEFDRIYVNGDNHIENLKIGDEKWKVELIEREFLKRMFE